MHFWQKKGFFINVAFSIAFSLAVNYLIIWYRQQTPQTDGPIPKMVSGQHCKPSEFSKIENHKPLNVEVDFLDKSSPKKTTLTTLETEHARYVFSTDGASLETLEFKRNWGGKKGYLSTVFTPAITEKQRRCFLVALGQKTPYYFDLMNKHEDDDCITLKYQASCPEGVVHKEFVIFKHEYRLDLLLTIDPIPTAEKPIQARIFYPAPFISELGKDDWIKAIVTDVNNTVQSYEKTEETLEGFWPKPTLFGAQDRYFIHALVHDHNNFAQRGYYKVFDLESLYAIVEGPEIQHTTSWKLSFYCGPKEDAAIKRVDERLSQILNYGWLAPISRPVSKFLLDILNLIFEYVKNYGLAIILLTILMKLLLLPFTFKSEQAAKKQAEYQKHLHHIKEKYKHDKAGFNAARVELVQKYGMPSLAGCLPILFQIPLFIALSWVLNNSIELYMAPFVWIKDLSASDPYYILPVALGISMLFHTPAPTAIDPRQKFSVLLLAIFFAAFATNFSAGLVLYMLTSTILGVIQASITRKFVS